MGMANFSQLIGLFCWEIMLVIVTSCCALSREVDTNIGDNTSIPENSNYDVISANEGHTAMLPCEVTYPGPKLPPYVIEWFIKGNPVPIFIQIGKYPPHVNPQFDGRMKLKSGTASLQIFGVKSEDDGWYECRVLFLDDVTSDKSNDVNGASPLPLVNGTWIRLRITVPPSFSTIPPPSISAREKDPLHLRCRASGRPSPVITWHKDGWIVRNGENGIRLSGGELAISSLEKSHAGRYTCKALNAHGQVEHTTNLLIQGPPTIIRPPHNATVKEGQEAMFSCRAEGFPSDIIYSWFFNDEPVAVSNVIRGRFSVSPTGTLVIFNVNPKDKGKVTCRADNGFGEAPSYTASLVVQYRARVLVMPSFIYAGLGLATTIHCPSVAEPPVNTVTWRKNGETVSEGGRYSINQNGSLLIDKINLLDAGKYKCTPFNSLGTRGESTGSNLIIRDPPYFTTVPDARYEAKIGRSITIPCAGQGDPPPHIYWTKGGEENSEPSIKSNGGRVSWVGGNLSITSVSKSDYGHWKCVLSNAVAEVASDVILYVKHTTPHKVYNMSVITSVDSAILSWNPGYNGGYVQHFMIWFKRADKGDNMWQTISVDGNRRSTTIRNLEPDTIYQFSILPENVLGSGQFSKTVSAKTKPKPTPKPTMPPVQIPAPTKLTYLIDEGLVVLSWKPPVIPEDDENIKLLGYVIEYRMKLHEKVDVDLNNITNVEEDSKSRSRRNVLGRIFKQSHRRIKRASEIDQPAFESDFRTRGQSRDSDDGTWTTWETLMAVFPNQTSYTPLEGELYRDQVYQFQLLAVSKSAYSSPSAPITVYTNGLNTYHKIKYVGEPGSLLASEYSPAVVAGVVTGVIFIILVLLLLVTWCYKNGSQSEVIHEESDKSPQFTNEMLEAKSKQKVEVGKEKEAADNKKNGKSTRTRGSFSKLRKKVLKAEMKSGNYGNVGSDVTDSKLKDNGTTPIRKISRASDGKFHVSEDSRSEESQSLMTFNDQGEDYLYSPCSTAHSPSRQSYHEDIQSPLLKNEESVSKIDPQASTLEIDCSGSDIAVRFVHDTSYNPRPNRSSVPQLYNLSRRVTEPYPVSPGDNAYPNTSDYQRALSVYSRPKSSSNYVTLSPYAQYVHLNEVSRIPPVPRQNTNQGRTSPRKNTEHRVSSPPQINAYNPTPASPSKARYHKHLDQPGGHYHMTPRNSIVSPNYDLQSPLPITATRHSSFMNNPSNPINRNVPQRQSYHESTATPTIVQTTNVKKKKTPPPVPPKPKINMSKYNTLPSSLSNSKLKRSVSNSNAPSSRTEFSTDGYPTLETSLSFHNANKERKIISGTNSLGREKRNRIVQSKRVKSLCVLTPEDERMEVESHLSGHSNRIHSYDDILLCRDMDERNEQNNITSDKNQKKVNEEKAIKDLLNDGLINENNTNSMTTGSKSQEQVKRATEAQSPNSQITDNSDRHPSEGASSGYDSQNTSHASGSPIPLLCPLPTNPPSVYHRRFSIASSTDRRKDTSSVDEKYEWDSEAMMESEILEALRHFGSQKRTMPVSKALLNEIQKLGSVDGDIETNDVIDSTNNYSKESMDRRCAALKQEYLRFQKEQSSSNDRTTQQ